MRLRLGRQAALVVAIAALAGVALLGATYLGVRGQVDAVYATQFEQLAAIGRLRAAQIAAWRAERVGDARATAGSPSFADAVAQLVDGTGPASLETAIEAHLQAIREAYRYENVLLLDRDGGLLVAAQADHAAVTTGTRALIDRVSEAGARPDFDDALIGTERDHVHIDVAVAIRDASGEPVAVLVLRSDPTDTLYPRLLDWPTTSPSGETVLVRREGERVVFLSAPRLSGGVPPEGIDLARGDVPAAQAVLGRTGRFEGRDYRGVEVLADLRAVPGTAWFLVDKVDAAEIAGDAWQRGGVVLVLAVLTASGVGGLVVLLFFVRQQAILRRLYEAERERAALAAHYDRLFALARDAFLLIDPSGRIVEANDAALAMYGYARDELLAMTVRDLRAPETLSTAERDWDAAARPEGMTFETVQQRRDGTGLPVEISSRPLAIDGRPYRQSIVRDITERKRAESALTDQLDELRRWNAAALGREERVLILKQEVNELLAELERAPRYDNGARSGGSDDG